MKPLSRRNFILLGLATGGITFLAIFLKFGRKCTLESFPILRRADWKAQEPNPEEWFVYDLCKSVG